MKKLILLKYRVMDGICSLRNNNKGMGTVEIILIIVVLRVIVLRLVMALNVKTLRFV